MSNNYITRCHGHFELVGVSLLEFESQFEAVRTSSEQRAWHLRTPGWAAQQNEKEVLLSSEELGGQYVAVCSVSNSPLTHNPFATLSNKVWEVYFSKELCLFVIIVDYVSACICIRIVVSWPYNILTIYHLLSVTLCEWSAKQTITLSVLARNQMKPWARGLWRDRKWARERESELERGT